MLKYLEQEARYIEITGFENIKVEEPEQILNIIRRHKNPDLSIQFFNADLIATWEHLYFAAVNALKAFETERNISKDLAVEIMLYASAQRQIRKAIEIIGINSNCTNIAVIIVGKTHTDFETELSSVSKYFCKQPNESVLKLTTSKKEHIRRMFGITDDEISVVTKNDNINCALVNLVLERTALLSTKL